MSFAIQWGLTEDCEGLEKKLAPTKNYYSDACYDIRSKEAWFIPAGERRLIGTGLILILPPLWEAQIRPRSGLAAKHGITVLNTPGTVDSEFRGEIKVILFNSSKEDFTVEKFDRIAQVALKKVEDTSLIFRPIKTLDLKTIRSDNGCGSSGVK